MVVYLASALARKEEMREVRSELRALGVCVHARWLDDQQMPVNGQEKWLRENAFIDIQDVLGCDIFVRFSDDLSTPQVPANLATGARFFEMGLAYKEGIPIVVVGPRQCLFDWLPLTHLPDKAALKRYLSPVEIM